MGFNSKTPDGTKCMGALKRMDGTVSRKRISPTIRIASTPGPINTAFQPATRNRLLVGRKGLGECI